MISIFETLSAAESGVISPGMYLREDPVCGTQLENQSELRAPTAERAAYFLDAAIAARTVPGQTQIYQWIMPLNDSIWCYINFTYIHAYIHTHAYAIYHTYMKAWAILENLYLQLTNFPLIESSVVIVTVIRYLYSTSRRETYQKHFLCLSIKWDKLEIRGKSLMADFLRRVEPNQRLGLPSGLIFSTTSLIKPKRSQLTCLETD